MTRSPSSPDSASARNFLGWLLEDVCLVNAEVGTPRDAQLKEFEAIGFLRLSGTFADTNSYEITNKGATGWLPDAAATARTCATCHAVLADGPQPAATYEAARASEPVAYQFRQRSAVGKGPQSSLPWCDWICIDREDYDRYVREPNKLVQVRPLYADLAQPSAARALADRAEGCLNCRNSAYPSDVLRECIKFLHEAYPITSAQTSPEGK